ncbi:lytic transglycosylase domain-containing protein [Oricola cellulosilytica]|uniref:Lytic transglycosylase domain-containing protein n=1 Tax=Oricola cellulosilytica TaxID=1429082 RepID=A0A4R0PDT6_9HYPH|nr:lytic transglycosylase domain-containing protein [Oricola cellulosilytica]TCD14365.1 lytic transglycosylase domain-containing protein [Oricola cellulosilytica]
MPRKFLLSTAVLLTLALAGCQTTADEDATLLSYAAAKKSDDTDQKSEKAGKDERPFASIVAKHAKANGVPTDLAHAVIFSESTYRPGARGSAGEIGLMQLKLATARGVGYSGSAKGLYDPETNIKYGMKYLGGAYKLAGGTTCGTILRYNAGHGAKRMNPISQAYCNKVARLLN